jgi:predicted glycosyltransferase
MNVAFYIAHPSQFFVFKATIERIQSNNNVFIFIKSKDILEDVMIQHGFTYQNISEKPKRNNFLGNIINIVSRTSTLYRHFKRSKIDLLITCASYSCQAAYLLGIPSIVLNDDDYPVIKKSALIGWPFASVILAPRSCSMGYWKRKTYFYNGFQKLGYLHPNIFIPNPTILEKYNLERDNYFIIRTVSLTAHHDHGIKGINLGLLEDLVNKLSRFGKVIISSEKELPENYHQYQLQIDHKDIHNLIYFSKLLIGDSQSMAHEAAVLGTPSIRINDFKNKIGVLNELESEYELTFSFLPDDQTKIHEKLDDIVGQDKILYSEKRDKMIENKIDLSKLLVWLINDFNENRKLLLDDLNSSAMNKLFL